MLSHDNARGRINQRALKIENAAQALSNPYGIPDSGRRAPPSATRRPRAPRPSPPPIAKRRAPAPLWSRMSYDQRVAWLSAIHAQHWLPNWVAEFLSEVGLGGLDDDDHAPLTVAVLDLLICATARELLGGAR